MTYSAIWTGHDLGVSIPDSCGYGAASADESRGMTRGLLDPHLLKNCATRTCRLASHQNPGQRDQSARTHHHSTQNQATGRAFPLGSEGAVSEGVFLVNVPPRQRRPPSPAGRRRVASKDCFGTKECQQAGLPHRLDRATLHLAKAAESQEALLPHSQQYRPRPRRT